MLLYFMIFLECFTDIWYNLWPFGIVCGHLIYFLRVGIFGPRKIWQPWCRELILTKNWLDHTLGDFITNSSGHSGRQHHSTLMKKHAPIIFVHVTHKNQSNLTYIHAAGSQFDKNYILVVTNSSSPSNTYSVNCSSPYYLSHCARKK
jgi:hypothetical protein